MEEVAGFLIDAINKQARDARAKAAARRGQPEPPEPPGGVTLPGALASVIRTRPAPPPRAQRPAPPPAPAPVASLPELHLLETAPSVPSPLLFGFRERSALLGSIVFAEALGPPLGLRERRPPQ